MCLRTLLLLLTSTLTKTLPASDVIKGTEPLICGLNEEPTNCVEPCLPTCETPNAPPCTFKLCLGGCVCRQGFIRETTKGKCVPINSCAAADGVSRNETIPECGKNEVLVRCASNCQETCERTDVSDCTKLFCAHGCVCKEGYIREEVGGVCISRNNCH